MPSYQCLSGIRHQVGDRAVTKTNIFFLAVLLSAICGLSHAEERPKVIAEGDWSKPVADAGG
jgi:hypothetical protein